MRWAVVVLLVAVFTGSAGCGGAKKAVARDTTVRGSPTPADQPGLDAAAGAARKVAGAYYTSAVVNDPSNTVTLYLSHAPQSILDRLKAMHRGVYVIHNDAPRPLRAVMKLMRSFDPAALKAQGINVTSYGPTRDGYLRVGVASGVAEAQAKLNAIYGPGIIRVVMQAPAVGL
jgi:hypothetical protein